MCTYSLIYRYFIHHHLYLLSYFKHCLLTVETHILTIIYYLNLKKSITPYRYKDLVIIIIHEMKQIQGLEQVLVWVRWIMMIKMVQWKASCKKKPKAKIITLPVIIYYTHKHNFSVFYIFFPFSLTHIPLLFYIHHDV